MLGARMDLDIIGDTVGVEHGFMVRDHVACNLEVVPGQQAWAALAGATRAPIYWATKAAFGAIMS